MPSKSDQIRKLLAEGKSRSEVARILGVTYQQVFQVDKKRHDAPSGQGTGAPRPPRPIGSLQGPSNYGALRGRALAPLRFGTTLAAGKPGGVVIRTGPTQVRVAVQDGHEVRLKEGSRGTECFHCGLAIQYSIRDLAYVHTDSSSPVTRLLAAHQDGPGLFDE